MTSMSLEIHFCAESTNSVYLSILEAKRNQVCIILFLVILLTNDVVQWVEVPENVTKLLLSNQKLNDQNPRMMIENEINTFYLILLMKVM